MSTHVNDEKIRHVHSFKQALTTYCEHSFRIVESEERNMPVRVDAGQPHHIRFRNLMQDLMDLFYNQDGNGLTINRYQQVVEFIFVEAFDIYWDEAIFQENMQRLTLEKYEKYVRGFWIYVRLFSALQTYVELFENFINDVLDGIIPETEVPDGFIDQQGLSIDCIRSLQTLTFPSIVKFRKDLLSNFSWIGCSIHDIMFLSPINEIETNYIIVNDYKYQAIAHDNYRMYAVLTQLMHFQTPPDAAILRNVHSYFETEHPEIYEQFHVDPIPPNISMIVNFKPAAQHLTEYLMRMSLFYKIILRKENRNIDELQIESYISTISKRRIQQLRMVTNGQTNVLLSPEITGEEISDVPLPVLPDNPDDIDMMPNKETGELLYNDQYQPLPLVRSRSYFLKGRDVVRRTQTAMDLMMLEEVTLDEYLNNDPENIIFRFGSGRNVVYYASNVNHVLTELKKGSNIKYRCPNINSMANVDIRTPYFSLRSLGITSGGVIQHEVMMRLIMDVKNFNHRIFKIIAIPVDRFLSTASHNVIFLSKFNRYRDLYVSASHCQEGQGETPMTILDYLEFNNSSTRKTKKTDTRKTASSTSTTPTHVNSGGGRHHTRKHRQRRRMN